MKMPRFGGAFHVD
jgi:hypothetical protein